MIYLHAVVYTALGRAIAISLATALAFGLIFLREATSPSGEGYWTAMAAAPNGALYVADEIHHELRLIQPDGTYTRLGKLPAGIFRALAADHSNLVLAAEGKLWVSNDTGKSWRSPLSGRFTAAAVWGSHELAGAWGLGLYQSDDSGATWSVAQVPQGDTEFEVIIPGFAATLLGLLRFDGQAWKRVAGIPDRVTALSYEPVDNTLRAGDWRGKVWLYDLDSGRVLPSAAYAGAVLSLAGPVAATTNGIYPDRGGPLHGREVTRVVLSEDHFWAAEARGPIFYSLDGISGWRLVYQG